MTGHEAYVKFVFRLPGRPFKQDQLEAKLGLKPLSDTPGLEGYSRDSNRVEVGNWPTGQYVVVVAHKKAEIDTPAFREFLARAVEVVQGRAATAAGGIEGNMPWKKDGEKWHLGEKGFPARVRNGTHPAPKLIKLLRDIDPTLEFKWDVRDAVTVRPQGARASARSRPRKPRRWRRGSSVGPVNSTSGDSKVSVATRSSKATARRHRCSETVVRDGSGPAGSEAQAVLTDHLRAFKRAFGTGGE